MAAALTPSPVLRVFPLAMGIWIADFAQECLVGFAENYGNLARPSRPDTFFQKSCGVTGDCVDEEAVKTAAGRAWTAHAHGEAKPA